MNEAKHDPSHPLYYLANTISIDENFVQAIHEMYKQFALFTDFFDKQHTWQVMILLFRLECFSVCKF